MSRLFFPRPSTALRSFSAESFLPGAIIRLRNRPDPSPRKSTRVGVIKRALKQPLLWGGGLWLGFLVWNWPLAIAVASGVIGAIAVYLYQLRRLHVTWFDSWSETDFILSNQMVWHGKIQHVSARVLPQLSQRWSQCWRPGNRPLTLSLLAGGGLASVVATMTLIYRDLHSLNLVLAMGLQLCLVVVIGGALWWQSRAEADSTGDERSVVDPLQTTDQLWVDLTSSEAAIRLIAIYRSVNWVQTLGNDTDAAAMAMDVTKLTTCFRVMLANETNPSVQQALRDGLMRLQK